ncbi:TonB-dependent receptor, partial [Ursidibacter maritimus]|nr:TonB-dependent receptor [Ursidibacter maritimus]
DEYCSGPKCLSVLNEQGLKLDSKSGVNKIVDQHGGDITAKKIQKGWSDSVEYRNSKDEIMPSLHYKEHSPQHTLLDCSKIDCNKPFRVYVKKDENWQDIYAFQERQIDIKKLPNSKEYGQIQQRFIEKQQWGSTVKQYEESFFLLPFSAGYSHNNY